MFLEFWTKDRTTDETAFRPARADTDTGPAFEGFLEVIVGRRDRRGNTRTLAVDYRQGDLSRLADVRSALAAVLDTAASPTQ